MTNAQNARQKSKEYGKIEILREDILKYKGIEIGIFKEEPKDKTPARIAEDARTGKEFIYMVDTVPKNLYIPVLEHELYEIKHGHGEHKKADKRAEKTAKDLGVLEEFKDFKTYWENRKKKLEQEGI